MEEKKRTLERAERRLGRYENELETSEKSPPTVKGVTEKVLGFELERFEELVETALKRGIAEEEMVGNYEKIRDLYERIGRKDKVEEYKGKIERLQKQGINLLVVDDEYDRIGLEYVFKPDLEENFDTIDFVKSVAQAKERLGEKNYAVILSDIDMEAKGSGIELMKHVRENYSIPIILCSSNLEHEKEVKKLGGEFYPKEELEEIKERLREYGKG